ncbi:MAG: KAP family NTPase, partial [Actinomycetota bacterium]|nr:KAP family NTPase [Actinomycetota bacterium]
QTPLVTLRMFSRGHAPSLRRGRDLHKRAADPGRTPATAIVATEIRLVDFVWAWSSMGGTEGQSAALPRSFESVSRFHREFSSVMKGLGEDVQALVVFVDDLDRCLTPAIVSTFEASRLFLHAPHTAYVVGAHQRIIQAALDARYPARGDGDEALGIDYGPRRQDANVQWGSRDTQLLKDLVPSAVASDFLRLGMATFCVDKILPRKPTADAWTRDIVLRLPVHSRDAFIAAAATIERALNFLSGDRWTLDVEEHPLDPPVRPDAFLPPQVDTVSLFSGGLDSLAGAIDQLAAGASRHRTGKEGNCGYCWPCMIRRASMHHVGWDARKEYQYDALRHEELLKPRSKSGASLRAVLASMYDEPTPFDVLRNGPVPTADIPAFFDVYRRGRQELETWLRDGARGKVRTRLPAA